MIFLSFSSQNQAVADKVFSRLKHEGFDVWYSNDAVAAGQNYAKDIVMALQASKCIVLLYSTAASNSVHVQKELDLALKYKKTIYPLRIEEIEPAEAMEYFLSGSQYVDLFRDFDNALVRFTNQLKQDIGVKEDQTKKLNASNITSFAKEHFVEMGYAVPSKQETEWLSDYSVQKHVGVNPHKKENILSYLQEHCFYAIKGTLKMIVAPLFLESATASYLKAYEADLFWQARDVLWNQEDLRHVLISMGLSEELVECDDIDFKLKSNLADRLRQIDKRKNIHVLFYLFIKQPPVYEAKSYNLPLKGSYTNGEQMPHLYLNYTYLAAWWGYKKDDIESIPGKRYVGFDKAFETLRFNASVKESIDYENYDGRIAETLAEVFFKKNGLVVQKFGTEAILGNSLSFMQKTSLLEDMNASETIKKFMTSPDLLVIKLNEQNEMINSYMMDVKFRSYNSKSDYEKELQQGGELYKQAQKYFQNWGNVYLFLFIHLKTERTLQICIASVKSIVDSEQKEYELEKNSSFTWLEKSKVKELYAKAQAIWN